ncbi:MAG: hypothetical protein OJF52_003726 [Nitrospira sp.]|jgi:hypothetical protein|nr:MAG: hypothetical protein OJF52_003726 [Nitrospira sp.]
MTPSDHGLTHISGPLGEVLKEILQRAELRARLEAELGRPLTDTEFLQVAERAGGVSI